MGKETAISWTDHTFNPWWGCEKISPGCTHCYAATFAKRTGNEVWGAQAPRRFFGDAHWNEPLKWNRDAEKAGERRRVFCASMADWLEDREDLIPHLARLLDLIRLTPNLDWLLLTKRPENWSNRIEAAYMELAVGSIDTDQMLYNWQECGIAPPNVWIGTTVENQAMADKRIPELLKIPARVRFLSCEPLLEAVDLKNVGCTHPSRWPLYDCLIGKDVPGPLVHDARVHWVIAGGESGPGFRPSNPDWARSLRDQCKAANVAFHMKQMGGLKPSMMPPIPADLMIREFPTTTP
jgi:protein gp37